jgi:NADH:ubiquinone reductase (H+-translocating)
VERFAPGLKKSRTPHIRGHILIVFERAENSTDERERRRLLTFVIVGGGPTGVEMAGAIAELARGIGDRLPRHRSRIRSVVLVESGPRVLAAFPETLSFAAKRAIERLGVEIRLGTHVNRCGADGVIISNDLDRH